MHAGPGSANTPFFQGNLRPSGPDSLSEAYASLSNISSALGDLCAFFGDHLHSLEGMTSRGRSTIPMSTNELRYSAQRWGISQTVLLQAMSSITASSDAVTVDPLGGRGDYQRGGGSGHVARNGSFSGRMRSMFSSHGRR
jgi:hypothetical protein